MLPSMPILNLNSRDSSDLPIVNPAPVVNPPNQNIAPEPEKQIPSVNPVQDIKADPLPEVKEPEEDIVCVGTSDKRKLKSNPNTCPIPKKKKKTVQSDEDDDGKQVIKEDSGSSYAETYFLKVMKTVEKKIFEQFVSLLLEYEATRGSRVELFKKIENLFPTHPDLVEEFLDFLQPHEALACKKLRQKNFISEAWKLFKFIEPSQMNKLITILEQHFESTNMSVGEIKELINSLFKSQPQVALGLSSLFMNGPPPVRDDESYEKIPSLSIDGDSHEYETVHIPMQAVRDCSTCTCPCHSERDAFCSACHITVFNCKVYIKKDKILRTAKIEFDGHSTSDMLKKLNPEYFARREALEMMASSPSKVSMRGEKRERKTVSESDSKKTDDEAAMKSELKSDAPKELVHKVICEPNKFGHLEFYETMELTPSQEKQKVVSPRKRKPKTPKPPSDKLKVNLFPDVRHEVSKPEKFPLESCIKVEDEISDFMKANAIAEVVQESSVDIFKIDITSQDNVMDYKMEEVKLLESCKIEEVSQSAIPIVIKPDERNDNFENSCTVTHLIEDVQKYNFEHCFIEPEIAKQLEMPSKSVVDAPDNSPIKEEGIKEYFPKASEMPSKNVVDTPDNSPNKEEDIKECFPKASETVEETIKDDLVESHEEEGSVKEAVDKSTTEEATKEEVKTEVRMIEENVFNEMPSPSKKSWTREEDKVILEAFRREIDTEHTFFKISSSLPSRSVEDIQSRFRDLMILLEKITSGDS